jgi:hypothetical protein
MREDKIVKETGREDVSKMSVKQLFIVMQNVINFLEEEDRELEFWLERKGDKIYLCWGTERFKNLSPKYYI